MTDRADAERQRRWRLVLGEPAQDAIPVALDARDAGMDRVLEALYDAERRGGLGASQPAVARWLGDIRTYFPSSVVRVMQQDALDRLGLRQMLLEPEMLAGVEPDVHLVSTLLTLSHVIPKRTRETARAVVRKVVEDLQRRLASRTAQAVSGALSRASRSRRPRMRDLDWDRTIRANLRHYDPERRVVVPERLIGLGRRRSAVRDVVLSVDQSGSMAASVVYAGVFAAVLASLPALNTRMVVFDTSVVDLTEQLSDPVELLFGTQLGGGTDINRALAYCQQIITRPAQTILVLISDLFEGGDADQMLKRTAAIVRSGVTAVCLLALSDRGAPSYDHRHAAALAGLGVATFACTPDLFPELMAAAIQGRDLTAWAGVHDIPAVPGSTDPIVTTS